MPDSMLELVDLPVGTLPNNRCPVCQNLSYDMFRSESKIQELFRPKRVVIGNFDYVSASAFAGCHVCWILFRHVVQKATSIQDLYGLYKIVRIGLSLSLDDELALFCEVMQDRFYYVTYRWILSACTMLIQLMTKYRRIMELIPQRRVREIVCKVRCPWVNMVVHDQ